MRRGVFCIGTVCLASWVANLAQADIYAFTDEGGTVNLSNVPADSRYALLLATPESAASDPGKRLPDDAKRALYDSLIAKAAQAYEVETALLHAVITVESGYNPNAISKKGAVGLMQLMPETARRYGVTDPLDPTQNVQGGARYLRDLLAMFNRDLRLTLAAYNAGENAVVKHGNRVPPYRETANYVPKVMALYESYRAKM
jgi:soluble lytic murein transglycosylase-like protein